jgi:hypothetical protein
MDIEDSWSMREDRVQAWRNEGQSMGPSLTRGQKDQQ